MFAVSWGCKKMHIYIHGLSQFTIQTDHKPLIPILNNKMLVDMSPRIQRMKMTLLPYTFTAEHVKGTTLKDAHALSRAPTEQQSHEDQIAEQEIINLVNLVVQTMSATDKKLNDIHHRTKYDQKGWPSSIKDCPELVQLYFTSRHDISELDGILRKGR